MTGTRCDTSAPGLNRASSTGDIFSPPSSRPKGRECIRCGHSTRRATSTPWVNSAAMRQKLLPEMPRRTSPTNRAKIKLREGRLVCASIGCVCVRNHIDLTAGRAMRRRHDEQPTVARRTQMPQPPPSTTPPQCTQLRGKSTSSLSRQSCVIAECITEPMALLQGSVTGGELPKRFCGLKPTQGVRLILTTPETHPLTSRVCRTTSRNRQYSSNLRFEE